MNKFIGIGRLTKEIELRETNSGRSVVSNTIAIKNDFKNANGEYDSEFVNIQVWGKTAEFLAQYAQKGMLVGIEGRVTTRSYDDADGNKRYVTEVICNSVELLEKKSQLANATTEEEVEETTEETDPYAEFGDEIDVTDNFLE